MSKIKKKVWIPILCAVVVLIGGIAGWLIYSEANSDPNKSPQNLIKTVFKGVNNNDITCFENLYFPYLIPTYTATEETLSAYREKLKDTYGEDVKLNYRIVDSEYEKYEEWRGNSLFSNKVSIPDKISIECNCRLDIIVSASGSLGSETWTDSYIFYDLKDYDAWYINDYKISDMLSEIMVAEE